MLAEIDADLTAAYEARRAAMKRASYGLPGGRSESKQSLADLNATITGLQAERQQVMQADDGQSGISLVPTMRGW